jgi:hypothetical protein
VCFAALWRHQLRDGARRMGSAVGSLLERPSLLIKESVSDCDVKQDKLLLAEGLMIGDIVLGIYFTVSLEVIRVLYRFVLLIFN